MTPPATLAPAAGRPFDACPAVLDGRVAWKTARQPANGAGAEFMIRRHILQTDGPADGSARPGRYLVGNAHEAICRSRGHG